MGGKIKQKLQQVNRKMNINSLPSIQTSLQMSDISRDLPTIFPMQSIISVYERESRTSQRAGPQFRIQ